MKQYDFSKITQDEVVALAENNAVLVLASDCEKAIAEAFQEGGLFVIETKVRGLESRIKELEAERNNLKSALIAVARGGKYDLAIDNANLRAINRELVDAIRTAWMTRNVEGLEEYANANEQEKSKSDG